MTDPVTQIKTAVQAETDTLKGVAQQFEQKQVGWIRSNWMALVIGFALGLAAGLIL